jgi:hypothetical protein
MGVAVGYICDIRSMAIGYWVLAGLSAAPFLCWVTSFLSFMAILT